VCFEKGMHAREASCVYEAPGSTYETFEKFTATDAFLISKPVYLFKTHAENSLSNEKSVLERCEDENTQTQRAAGSGEKDLCR
jgi:hypothetical protein